MDIKLILLWVFLVFGIIFSFVYQDVGWTRWLFYLPWTVVFIMMIMEKIRDKKLNTLKRGSKN